LGEPGCHEGERSGLAGRPRRGLRGRSGSSARPWTWKLPSMQGTPWNLPPRTATGSSYSAPATATSSSTAATATAPSRYSRRTTRIGRGRAGPQRRRATRRAGVRRHLDLASPSGRPTEHPQPGRPHGVAGRQEDSGRTRSICGRRVRVSRADDGTAGAGASGYYLRSSWMPGRLELTLNRAESVANSTGTASVPARPRSTVSPAPRHCGAARLVPERMRRNRCRRRWRPGK
jgi:hypothetical protein